jgi:hypothetical protein
MPTPDLRPKYILPKLAQTNPTSIDALTKERKFEFDPPGFGDSTAGKCDWACGN